MEKVSKEYYKNRIKFLEDELKRVQDEFPEDSAQVGILKDALAWNQERLQLYSVECFYAKFGIEDTLAPEDTEPVDVGEIIFEDK